MAIANSLSIAGSDPSGGAGIQADLKAFAACGTYGMAVLAALTAQNTQGVSGVHLVPPAYDPSHYDVVVLGTPVWAGNISSPLRSYVAAHKAELRQVAFFCTQGGSGAEKVFPDLQELCGRAPLATLAVSDRDIT